METRWLYTTSENFHALREASKGTCVIPMGCLEKHGLHLPVGTDIIQASGVAYTGSQLETVTVFPDFTFGDFPDNSPTRPLGSITLPMEMEMDLLEVLCEQITANGYKKIHVLNAHGGNKSWLAAFSRRLVNKKRNFVFATYHIGLPAPHIMAEYLLANGSGSIPELTLEDEKIFTQEIRKKMLMGLKSVELGELFAQWSEEIPVEINTGVLKQYTCTSIGTVEDSALSEEEQLAALAEQLGLEETAE